MGILIFSFNRYCQMVFQSHTNLYLPAACESSDCSTSLPTLDIKAFFMLAVLICVYQYHIVVLMFTSWMTYTIEHFSTFGLLVLLLKCLYKSFDDHFSTVLPIFFLFTYKKSLYIWRYGPLLGYMCYNLLSLGCLFILLMVLFDEYSFIFLKHIFLMIFILKNYFSLEDNCFTILCWFLPYININQP